MIERFDLALLRKALQGRVSEAVSDAKPGDSHAAVAAVLRDRGAGAEVLLIRRASRVDDPWSGHMALPGGRREPLDRDLLQTAVRETREEIGLDLTESAKLIGELDALPVVSRGRRVGMIVTPFVFELSNDPPLLPNHEVEEVIWAPLARLAGGELTTTIPIQFEGNELLLPAWDVEGRIVWGLTYRMLETLLALTGSKPSKP